MKNLAFKSNVQKNTSTPLNTVLQFNEMINYIKHVYQDSAETVLNHLGLRLTDIANLSFSKDQFIQLMDFYLKERAARGNQLMDIH